MLQFSCLAWCVSVKLYKCAFKLTNLFQSIALSIVINLPVLQVQVGFARDRLTMSTPGAVGWTSVRQPRPSRRLRRQRDVRSR